MPFKLYALVSLLASIILLSGYQLVMKGSEYHNELTPIVEDIVECTKKNQGVPSQFLELEFKHGYFKGPDKSKYDVQALEYQTLNRPMVLSFSEKYKRIKVNARCDPPYFQNAKENLQAFAKKSNCRVEEKYFLFFNWLEQRFYYDCSDGKWARADKQPLFTQCNVMNQKKFYRINYCRKEIYSEVEKLVKELKLKEWIASKSFLRFKHSIIYHIDAHYSIECTTAYESQSVNEYIPLEKAIQNNSDLTCIIKEKLYQKRNQTKNELELKFSAEGIDFIKVGGLQDIKILVTKAFDQFRDITNQLSGQDLVKMMKNLSIETKQERKQEKKVEQKEVGKEISQLRRQFRKRQA